MIRKGGEGDSPLRPLSDHRPERDGAGAGRDCPLRDRILTGKILCVIFKNGIRE